MGQKDFEKKLTDGIAGGKTIVRIFPFRFLYVSAISLFTLLYCSLLMFNIVSYQKWILLALLTGMVVAVFLASFYEYRELALIFKQRLIIEEIRKNTDKREKSG